MKCNMLKLISKESSLAMIMYLITMIAAVAASEFLEEVAAPNLDTLDQQTEASQGFRSYRAWSVPGPPYHTSGSLSTRCS